MSAKVTAEFVALPCGLRELTRAIAHALKRTDRHTSRATDVESSDSAKEYPVTPGDSHSYREFVTGQQKISLPILPVDPYESTGMARPEMDVMASAVGGAQAPVEQLSSTFQQVSHSSEPHMREPQDSTVAALIEQRLPELPSPMRKTEPISGSPLVLLVDDNSINLQLLVRFAKKHKYEYITAADGKLALEAFENAHRSASTPPSPDATRTAGITRDGAVPTVILMDINMPVVSFSPLLRFHYPIQRS